jgi:hypothetical protein
MDRLDRHVREELGRFGPADGDMVAIVRAWPGAVGETVARNAWPARLARDGTLHVNTSSATWAFELGKLAGAIAEKLRPELGDATPSVLRFMSGPVPEPAAETPEKRREEAPKVATLHLEEGARIAAGIEDDELRAYVARAAAASLAKGSQEPRSDRRF